MQFHRVERTIEDDGRGRTRRPLHEGQRVQVDGSATTLNVGDVFINGRVDGAVETPDQPNSLRLTSGAGNTTVTGAIGAPATASSLACTAASTATR